MHYFHLNFLIDGSDEGLIAELQRVSNELVDQPLTTEAFNRASRKVHAATVIRRFGSWKAALEKAALIDRIGLRRYTDLECFESLAAAWTQLGRPPLYREMGPPNFSVGAKAYKRWGSWRKALQAFVEWANAETASVEERPHPISEDGRVHRSSDQRREIPLRLKWKVHLRDNFRCLACGKNPSQHGVVIHVDHIVPWADGGPTILENLQTLCEPCNLGKGRSHWQPQ